MPNRLAASTSPYLQQHRDNPVDWHEWGAEALALAQSRSRPILLSVGYSACHWCHVMAHESFEDEGIAALMNEHFVNIKVDREERPDLDQIYQTAHALLTQRSGGWPLTLFLTADCVPFFGGTYFPKSPRYGLPGFADLLAKVAAYHREHAGEIRAQNGELLKALARQRGEPLVAGLPGRESIDTARKQIGESFDRVYGGFGHAPKFPHPEMIDFCLRRAAADHDGEARDWAGFTLAALCQGGIFDQLGGGFARYSVDAQWAIPHFEKMLYDNGPLLRLLADAWLAVEDGEWKDLYAQAAEATAAWLMREMQSPAGGYYATLDADSEGHEGKFYVWGADEARSLLTEAEWRVAARHFGLDRRPNFENEYWHLVVTETPAETAQALELPPAEVLAAIASARAKLFARRETRVRPGRDEKILVSWNALMIEGMARAARVFGRPEWLASARKALDFLRATLWDEGRGRLFATHRDGKTHLNAYLDDYAYLLKALIEMMQAEFRAEDLDFARQIAAVLLEQFEDREGTPARGGFFFTSHDHEPLIQRPKPSFDNATPSGNGVAAFALQRLGHLCGEPDYLAAAERTLACFAGAIDAHPAGHGSLLIALEEALVPPTLVILTGPAAACAHWQRALDARHQPATLVVSLGAAPPASLPEALRKPASASVQAWVCRGVRCDPPHSDLVQLQDSLLPGA